MTRSSSLQRRANLGRGVLAAAFSLAAALSSGGAAANLLVNGSFEGAPPVTNGTDSPAFGAGSTAITGWTVFSNESNPRADIQWINNANRYGTTTPFGESFVDLTGLTDSSPYARLQQGFATVVGTKYAVTFSLGCDNGSTVGNFSCPISANVSISGFGVQTFTETSSASGNQWQDFEYDFTATSTFSALRFEGLSGGVFIGLDHVDAELAGAVTTPPVVVGNGSIPEPAPLALLALGLAAAIAARRRSR